MRGSTMSSANFVWPVHFARASTLRKGFPTTLSGLPLLPFCFINQYTATKRHKMHKMEFDRTVPVTRRLVWFLILCAFCAFLWLLSFVPIKTLTRQLHFFSTDTRGGQLYRFVDFDIARAATEIPRQCFFDFIARRIWQFVDQLFCCQQKSR